MVRRQRSKSSLYVCGMAFVVCPISESLHASRILPLRNEHVAYASTVRRVVPSSIQKFLRARASDNDREPSVCPSIRVHTLRLFDSHFGHPSPPKYPETFLLHMPTFNSARSDVYRMHSYRAQRTHIYEYIHTYIVSYKRAPYIVIAFYFVCVCGEILFLPPYATNAMHAQSLSAKMSESELVMLARAVHNGHTETHAQRHHTHALHIRKPILLFTDHQHTAAHFKCVYGMCMCTHCIVYARTA